MEVKIKKDHDETVARLIRISAELEYGHRRCLGGKAAENWGRLRECLLKLDAYVQDGTVQ